MKTTQYASFTRPLIVASIMALGAAGSAHATTTFNYNSDAEFQNSGFSKVGGVNVRWGDSIATGGDWEFSVVDGSDTPQDEQNVNWSDHGVPELRVDFDAQGISADLDSTSGEIAQSSWMTNLGGYNTVLFRAKATDQLQITDIFLNGMSLGGLTGDSDANYIGVTVEDLLSGSLSLNFTASPGNGSDPGLQVKFGNLPTASVPEPSSLGLFALGMAGIFAASRRRSRKA